MKKITINTKELVINKYVHLLTIIILSFIAFPLITEKERPYGIPLISLLLTFTLLAALRAIVKDRKNSGCSLLF
jgi:predicted tellurium resistance membrane protein TerC